MFMVNEGDRNYCSRCLPGVSHGHGGVLARLMLVFG